MYDRDKLLLTVSETAYVLNCSAASVYKLIHAGELRYKMHGKAFRIPSEDVENYVRSSLHNINPESSEQVN